MVEFITIRDDKKPLAGIDSGFSLLYFCYERLHIAALL